MGLCLWVLALSALMAPQGRAFGKVEHILDQAVFCQTRSPRGEYTQNYGDDEMFRVDLEKRESVFRLPEFTQYTSFDAQGALGIMPTCYYNLDIYIKRSNHTPATKVAPEVRVYPENPVELGEPNLLICFMNKFFPPSINVTWLKNGSPTSEGVGETDFYSTRDNMFRKFHYLTFMPAKDDIYACRVEHWGLESPIEKIWNAEVLPPPSEMAQTVVCALGLAVGIVGIILGTVLIIKGMRQNGGNRRGPI
ncbi:H-2 class II histocompatibility antigen, A-Q alpha chain-like [Rhinatrema bivittatum]|uniref:H-2 class II histocompatibility antigen, A-Q alpha chain-like n=1 Tax=Rhinatrema bivittatum TaxID=194408 RepID=UPI001126CB3B|nr:H-2 class II histocompatibility antigen, A-Q alpha chain-like [Rhinatrema bivittatum]XP_029440574.1 H-2 class II histocompatibility antigen, A-Q alpha chain-like [Rhinatrema bivittatum]